MVKKGLFISIISVGLVFLISTTSHAAAKILKFATAISPPFTILNANQELQGFDIDIAKALCEKMQVQCTFNNDHFSNMILSLKTNKYDAWINAISIDEYHQKDVSFSKPYFSSTIQLMAIKDTTFNAAPVEIKGKTIGAEENSCFIHHLKNAYGDTIKIRTFPTESDAYIALEKGTIDAVIGDSTTLMHWRSKQKDSKKYRLIGLPAKYSNLVWHKYGIAIAKDNVELMKKLNDAINQIKSDGTLRELVKKYFGN